MIAALTATGCRVQALVLPECDHFGIHLNARSGEESRNAAGPHVDGRRTKFVHYVPSGPMDRNGSDADGEAAGGGL
jgi:hypothetical protein